MCNLLFILRDFHGHCPELFFNQHYVHEQDPEDQSSADTIEVKNDSKNGL